MKKKLLFSAFILAIATLLPIQSKADEFSAVAPSGQTLYYIFNGDYFNGGPVVEVTCQNVSSPYYTTYPTGSLEIPSSVTYYGETYSVTSIGGRAFSGCSGLTSVTIPNSVTSIGNYAFEGCSGLTSVTIPNSVTSIGTNAFQNCTGLTTVNFNATNCTHPGSSSVFRGCTAFATLNIGNNVTNIPGHAFSGCSGLTSVTIPNSVTFIGNYAFFGCSGLTSVTIGNSVTFIGIGAFSDCTGLTTVNFNATNWTTTYEDGMVFYGCTAPATLNIGDNVRTIRRNAFIDWAGLTTVNFNATNCTTMGSCDDPAFSGCTALATLNIGDNVTNIPSCAFNNCSSLTSVTIGNSVTSIGSSAFYGCSGLTSVYYTGDIAGWCGIDFASNPLYYAHNLYINDNIVTDLVIPNSVTEIRNSAFSGATCLSSLTIPNSVTSIGFRAFDGCSGLTSVTIPNSVTSIGNGAFQYCTGLTTVNFNATNCTYMGSQDYTVFYGCTAFATLNIDNNVRIIPNNAFKDCAVLTSITIPNSVTTIGDNAFKNCSNLEEIHSLAALVPSLGTDAFSGVSNTIPVYVPCGCQSTYYSRWTYFSNIIEGSAASLSVSSSDITMGTAQVLLAPTCDNPQAIVMATPNSGYRFDHWSDGSTANPYTLTVTTDMTLTAHFVSAGGGTQGIDDITSDQIKLYSRGSEIVIEGIDNSDALVYDILGRIVHKGRIEGHIHVNNTGVYMVKVGDQKPQKVVVR